MLPRLLVGGVVSAALAAGAEGNAHTPHAQGFPIAPESREGSATRWTQSDIERMWNSVPGWSRQRAAAAISANPDRGLDPQGKKDQRTLTEMIRLLSSEGSAPADSSLPPDIKAEAKALVAAALDQLPGCNSLFRQAPEAAFEALFHLPLSTAVGVLVTALSAIGIFKGSKAFGKRDPVRGASARPHPSLMSRAVRARVGGGTGGGRTTGVMTPAQGSKRLGLMRGTGAVILAAVMAPLLGTQACFHVDRLAAARGAEHAKKTCQDEETVSAKAKLRALLEQANAANAAKAASPSGQVE